jgi:hypothetical protein
MRIDIFDGTVEFERGAITRCAERVQFLESAIGQAAKASVVNEGWLHYDIDPEEGVAGTVIFKGDAIDRIFLAMSIPSDQSQQWTVEIELERKAKHDQWLSEHLGKSPYDYAWGRVVSEFDPKGLASEIIVVYGS